MSWDDGMALTKWASEQTGQTILLPSEAEWEKAARGGLVVSNSQNPLPKRQYPWGDTFDKSKCNTHESGIKDTSPVDKYLQGASPYGVLDLSGMSGNGRDHYTSPTRMWWETAAKTLMTEAPAFGAAALGAMTEMMRV
ncbi:MAG: SUMF1/EgtB/PvdO family nonheme iron enzyme [Chloroflexi bacterium]|nr:SUMF1/EgtB/PvdO family nonheme iron enzyme [Chloroflexota bacterium]